MDNDDNVMSEGMKKLEKLYKKSEAYCRELVFFGFNSASYEVKLIKKFVLKELKFLDVLQFLAPGYNLKSFAQSL